MGAFCHRCLCAEQDDIEGFIAPAVGAGLRPELSVKDSRVHQSEEEKSLLSSSDEDNSTGRKGRFVTAFEGPLKQHDECDMNDPEEFLRFFDCESQSSKPPAVRNQQEPSRRRVRTQSIAHFRRNLGDIRRGDEALQAVVSQPLPYFQAATVGRRSTEQQRQDSAVDAVMALAKESWESKPDENGDLRNLDTQARTFRELAKLLQPSAALRVLTSCKGDIAKAARCFEKSIDMQLEDRLTLMSRECKTTCNFCILGYDLEGMPVMLLSMSSIKGPVADMKDQVILALQGAAELAGDTGQFSLVIDMKGFQAHSHFNKSLCTELAERMTSIHCSRLKMALLVDWSRTMRVIWCVVQNFLSERSRKKTAFVSESEALELCRHDFEAECVERITSAFATARTQDSPADALIAQASKWALDAAPFSGVNNM